MNKIDSHRRGEQRLVPPAAVAARPFFTNAALSSLPAISGKKWSGDSRESGRLARLTRV